MHLLGFIEVQQSTESASQCSVLRYYHWHAISRENQPCLYDESVVTHCYNAADWAMVIGQWERITSSVMQLLKLRNNIKS